MKVQFLGPLCAFGSSVTWAIGSALYGKLSAKHSPFTVNFLRAAVAVPFHLILALIFVPASFAMVNLQSLGWMGLSMVSSYILGDALFMKCVSYIGLSASLAIASAFPFWSALVGWLFRGEVLGVERFFGLLLVVAGSVAVIRGDSKLKTEAVPGLRNRRAWGIALAIFTSILWSFNPLAMAEASTILPVLTVNAVRMTFALIVCPLLAVASSGPTFLSEARVDIKKHWPIFLLEAGVGSFLYVYGASHAPLAVAAALSSLAPVVSVPVSIALNLEKPSGLRIAGVFTVVSGVLLLVTT